MSIKFATLTLRNFLSYGNNTTVVQLERPGTTLIVGEDLDNTSLGQGSNGVGKSTIINALTYAIYDKPISKVKTIDSLVNNINKKNMEVTLEFFVKDIHYRIRRERKAKAGAAGNNVYFYVNGADKTLDSDGTNKLIESVIGIPYEIFVRMVVFSASHIPFLELPATHQTAPNQKDIIEELFGLTDVTQKATLLKQQIKDNEASHALKKAKLDLLEKDHARHTLQVDNAKKRVATWDASNTEHITNLFTKLEAVATIDFETEKKAHADVATLQSLLLKEEEKLRVSQRNYRDCVKEDKTVTDELVHLRDAKCPRCLQNYAGAQTEVDELNTRSLKLSSSLVDLEALTLHLNNNIAELHSTLSEASQKITVHQLDDLLEIKNQSASIKTKIAELDSAVNPFVDSLQELMDIQVEPINYDDINETTRIIEHQKFLLKLLTKNDSFVRKSLLNKNIPYLNSRLKHYLTLFGLPHQVEFTHELTAKITQFGNALEFGLMSAGQKARINIALSFSFIDVLQRLHTKLNICMLDEVLDQGLDAVGIAAAARVIKRKARDEHLSMYIISHKSEIDGVFDGVLKVQLEKGFSHIMEEK